MEDTPPRPTFPTGCTISILIFIGLFILSIVIDKFTEKKDPNNPKKKKSNNYVVFFMIVSVLLLVIIGSSCTWWHNMKKREWNYRYGSSTDKAFQLASDVIDILDIN